MPGKHGHGEVLPGAAVGSMAELHGAPGLSGVGPPLNMKTRLVANIEKARLAMSRLEEIFTQNPGLQSTQVMKQLLDCYKECRSVRWSVMVGCSPRRS